MVSLLLNETDICAEITISKSGNRGSTPMSPEKFIKCLRANGFVGKTASNPNCPQVVWVGFKNNT